jgi:xylulose-5-phosphate/fructose-6-phosphate phosphoketolase
MKFLTGSSLCLDVIDRAPQYRVAAAGVKEWLGDQIREHLDHARKEGIDKDEIRNWIWVGSGSTAQEP